MKRAVIKSSDLVQRAPKKDVLLHALAELIHALTILYGRVEACIAETTHAEAVDEEALLRDCAAYLKEYHYLAHVAEKVADPVMQKIDHFYEKKGFVKQDPFEAYSWSPVQLLHLLREQAMGRRQQEIQEIEKRKKDVITQYEQGLKACEEKFHEVVPQLNLLCYMRDYLKKEHALPANVMYHTKIPMTVHAPVFKKKEVVRQQIKKPEVPRIASPPAPIVAPAVVVREEKMQEAYTKPDVQEKDQAVEELKAKRQALLLKMRSMQEKQPR